MRLLRYTVSNGNLPSTLWARWWETKISRCLLFWESLSIAISSLSPIRATSTQPICYNCTYFIREESAHDPECGWPDVAVSHPPPFGRRTERCSVGSDPGNSGGR